MGLISEVIAIVFECFVVTRMLLKYFQLESNENKIIKVLLLFFMLLGSDLLGTFYIRNEKFLISTCLLIEIIYSILLLKGDLFEKLLVSVINYLLTYFINLPTITLMGIISSTPTTEIVASQGADRLICLFITKLLYFLATQVILWIRKKDNYNFNHNEWIIIVSAFLLTLMIGFAMHAVTVESVYSTQLQMAITFLLSALDVIIFFFMRKMSIASKIEREQEINELKIKQQQNELKKLEENYNEISILRHDYQNSLECICSMISDKKYSDVISYVEKLKERKLASNIVFVKSESSVINAVINFKFSKAQTYGIITSFRLVVTIPEELEFDLSIILSNLLDNAIEACIKNKIPSQVIATISEVRGYFRIVVRNTIENSVLKNNKLMHSSKTNKKEHGWGLNLLKT